MRTNMWFFSAITFVVLSSVSCFPFPLLSPFSNFPSFPSISAFPSIPNLSLQPVAFAALPLTSSPLGSISFTTKASCKPLEKNFEDSCYPSVDINIGDVAKLENVYSTEICTGADNTPYYKLKTTANVVSKSGVKSSKYIVYSYPKGDDDKPDLTRKIGQESGAGAAGGVVASSFQSLTF
uniref:Salivary sheath protein n=1 Tax=Nilaparvata lugens TaxID=108931 RepID=A0A220XIG6_NILLU|nr:salivary sheath protein [Nilaparvata lugens]